MIIALFPNERKKQSFEIARGIRDFLRKEGVTVAAEEEKAPKIGAEPFSKVDPKEVKFLISMGGDGTLLRIAHQFSHFNAPILGINLGQLGFMADVPVSDIYPSLTDLLKGNYKVDQRLMFKVSDGNHSTFHALNDVVLHRAQNYSLIELSISVDGIYVNTFLADGVIIATPTGSTAYNLAAGGPILSPQLEVLALTPICPHTISNRPIILPANCTLQIKYLSDYDPIDARLDGVIAFPVLSSQEVTVKKSEKTFQLVTLPRHEYFSTLRTKLGWSGKLK